MRECARVLRPGGPCAVSTPNRLTFSPGLGRGEKPLNPFHANELDAEELAELLAPWFGEVRVLGVHHGPRIAAWEREHGPLVAAQLAAEADPSGPRRWPTSSPRSPPATSSSTPSGSTAASTCSPWPRR